ncbi:MAG: SH3 domain-containing protein [Microcystaceae cyanobacterium]
MSRLSNLFQFILGFFVGVALLGLGAAALGYLFFARMSVSPPKPIFAQEKPAKSPVVQTKTSPAASKPKSETQAKPEAKATEKPKPEPSPQETEALPAGTYKARVTWTGGLSLREGPNIDSNRVGGVDHNTEIVILETSADQKWQKVRLSDGQEGWIKAGNAEKIQ